MKLEPVGIGTSAGRASRRRTEDTRQRVDAVSPQRALVPVSPRDQRSERSYVRLPGFRADAGFVAQLIATHLDMPQTRARRTANVEDVVTAYATARSRHHRTPMRPQADALA